MTRQDILIFINNFGFGDHCVSPYLYGPTQSRSILPFLPISASEFGSTTTALMIPTFLIRDLLANI
jgi:hypothetical protein